MANAPSSLALELLKETHWKSISNGGVQTAITTIATYLTTLRYQATAAVCASMLRDLIHDVLRAQGGQVNAVVVGTASSAENLIVDGPTAAAFATIRAYFAGLSLAAVPPVGALPAKQVFAPLCRLIAEAT